MSKAQRLINSRKLADKSKFAKAIIQAFLQIATKSKFAKAIIQAFLQKGRKQ
jgi:hypothetical protein